MEKVFLCLDVGGTEIKAAPVDGRGALLRPLRRFPARAGEPAAALLEHFASVIGETGAGLPDAAGVRFAFPGPFDYENGVCLLRGLAKFDSLYGLNLRSSLSARLGVEPGRIRFANDAAAFALGEMGFGCAAGASRALFVCIGTGCGSAFGAGCTLAAEGTPGVPENGYIYSAPYLDGCIDDYISRRGLMELSLDRMGESLDGRALAQRAMEGDARAAGCFLAFGERLRDALSPFLTGFAPELVCLGGQIMKSAPLFLPPLREACRRLGIELAVTDDTSVRALQGLTRI